MQTVEFDCTRRSAGIVESASKSGIVSRDEASSCLTTRCRLAALLAKGPSLNYVVASHLARSLDLRSQLFDQA